jgi:hypothetical protein
MSDDREPDDGEPEASPLDNLVQFKKPSGSQNRAKAAAHPLASGSGDIEGFDSAVADAIADLGPPPRKDPAALTVWQQELTGVIAWAWACGRIGPDQAVRLKGMAEAVRTGGMVAVKAIDRGLLAQIARRLGMKDTPEDGLDPVPPDAADRGRNHRRRKPAG